MNHSRNNEFTEKQIRGIDLVIKSVKKKYPFIKGWKFTKDFEKYIAHLYIDIIVDFDDVAKFYNQTLHPAYADRKFPLVSSLLYTFLSSNLFMNFDDSERQAFFEKNYNETKKITNNVTSLYEKLPEEFAIYYDYTSFDGTTQKNKVQLSVSEFFDVTVA